MKHFTDEGSNKMPEYDDCGYILREDKKNHKPIKDYEFSICKISNEDYDSMKEYEGPSHFQD